MLEQGLEGVGQHFVRTVTDENPFRRHIEMAGDCCLQLRAGRIRVKLQAICVVAELGADGVEHVGGSADRGSRWY